MIYSKNNSWAFKVRWRTSLPNWFEISVVGIFVKDESKISGDYLLVAHLTSMPKPNSDKNRSWYMKSISSISGHTSDTNIIWVKFLWLIFCTDSERRNLEEIIFTRPKVLHLQLPLGIDAFESIWSDLLIITRGSPLELAFADQWCNASHRKSPLGKLLRKCNSSSYSDTIDKFISSSCT